MNFLKKNIFSRFGVPRILISDGGSHFCKILLENLLVEYNVKPKVATPYHLQTIEQVEVSNRQIKHNLEKRLTMQERIGPASWTMRYWHIENIQDAFEANLVSKSLWKCLSYTGGVRA